MADRTIADRLQPSLLDRLTDEHPGETQDRREDVAIDVSRLRRILHRDISWLLNAGNCESLIDGEAFPNAVASVINFGVRAAAGGVSGPARAQQIRGTIQQALARFEPRLRPGSVQVALRDPGAGEGAVLAFDIYADIWAQPVPIQLYLRTQVNMATGRLTVERTG